MRRQGGEGCQAAGWRLAWRPQDPGAGSGSKQGGPGGVDPSHRHPHRWPGSPPGAFWLWPSHLLAQKAAGGQQRGAQVGVYEWLLLSNAPASLSSLPPEACPWHVFSSSCHTSFLSSCPSWACGHQGASGSAEGGPGVFLWLHVVAPPPGGASLPTFKPLAAAQVAAGDLRSGSHTGHRLNQRGRESPSLGSWSPRVGWRESSLETTEGHGPGPQPSAGAAAGTGRGGAGRVWPGGGALEGDPGEADHFPDTLWHLGLGPGVLGGSLSCGARGVQ